MNRIRCAAMVLLLTAAAMAGLRGRLPAQVVDPPRLSVEVAERVHVLRGLGTNVLAVLGREGTLLVDAGYARTVARLDSALAELYAPPVRTLVSTHYHWDHVGGNEHLARKGACIVGHVSTRERMLEEWRVPEGQPTKYGAFPVMPPYPEAALPDPTFDHRMRLTFDGWRVELIHFPAAHSGSDVAVFLRDPNIVHTGDLYLSNGFPIIDGFHGGSFAGLITALDSLIVLIDDQTIVVPGHGPPSDREGLRRYRTMLATAGERIAALVREGRTLDEVVAADPTAGLFPGRSWLPVEQFVWTAYADLTRVLRGGTSSERR